VVRRYAWSRNLKNEKAMAPRWATVPQEKKSRCIMNKKYFNPPKSHADIKLLLFLLLDLCD